MLLFNDTVNYPFTSARELEDIVFILDARSKYASFADDESVRSFDQGRIERKMLRKETREGTAAAAQKSLQDHVFGMSAAAGGRERRREKKVGWDGAS